MRVAGQWHVSGTDYARTCRAWLARHDEHRAGILALFAGVYGGDTAVWFVRWRLFYLACAELFDYAGGNEWFVTHVRLERRDES